ncbi:potassium voltage-gated channel subfamily H member 1-like [Saccostrea echinata]|uniref:potassium voltage-gated channel subfamily H member 1-like n=1 Tax=Saccostrea echinata TaxID=191078 RepID=UPI002A816D19|nr:potassium voltage-gated channel subfamily H member 1-like [Saccostrea echinata]
MDYPIVYCNDGFCKLSGYNRAEVMQKSSTCSFMYGDLTEKETVEKVETAFEETEQTQVEILLYKKNRTPLWLLLHIAPIRNEKEQVVLFLCTFKDITALKQPIDEEGSLSKFARLARSVTRNRSTLLQFSSHMPSTKFDNSKPSQIANMMSLNSDVLPQYRLEAPKTPPHIILHYCLFKTVWDWIILFLTFYTAVTVPYNTAFKNKTMDQVPLLVIDSIVDVVFFVDIILNFHTTFVGPSGEVISDSKIIRMNYLKSWFVVDVLSCLPYDVFNAFQYVDDGISTLFSALKVVRLLRLGRVVRKLDHYLEYGAAMLILLILVFILFAHWFACGWYSIGLSEIQSGISYGWLTYLSNTTGDVFYFLNGTSELDVSGGPGKGMRYLTSLYFTLSCMTGVGFGNVAANTEHEKLFSIFMMIIGALLYALIFSNVTTIFQQFYANFARYHDMLNSVREFMKLHDVPKSLSERVMDYIVSTWAITKGIDATKVLNYCPKDMKADLCVHLNRKVFLEHPAFRLASDGCLRALAMHFNMTHSAPGDLIFHQGESLDALCFVVTGSLEVIQDDEVVAILSKGDVFGDNFWKEHTIGQSTANVRALTYCDLHTIKRGRLLEVLEFYHAFANSFARNLTLTYNLRHRLIFRKVADVKKEKELAEKRKNDPPLELSSDHPVRKLISRFRKISDAKAMQTNTDPEKGSKADMNGGERGGPEKSRSFARLINVTENSAPKTGGGSSKWGKMVNGTGPSDGEGKQNKPNNEIKEEVKNGEPHKQQLKPAPKWGKMMGRNMEQSKDNEKEETQNNLRKSESMDSGIIRSNVKLDLINEETVEHTVLMRNETNNNITSRDTSLSAMSVAERHMLTSIHDIKLEMKEDMDILHQKMNRIDEQISEILRMFSPSSSPCSSNEDSTYPHSKDNSGGNTENNTSADPATESSGEESPKPTMLICDVDFIPKAPSESPILNLPKDSDANTTRSNSMSLGVSPISRLSSSASHSILQGNHIGQPSDTVTSSNLKESKEEPQSGSSNNSSKSNSSADKGHLQVQNINTVSNSSHKTSSDSSVQKTSMASSGRVSTPASNGRVPFPASNGRVPSPVISGTNVSPANSEHVPPQATKERNNALPSTKSGSSTNSNAKDGNSTPPKIRKGTPPPRQGIHNVNNGGSTPPSSSNGENNVLSSQENLKTSSGYAANQNSSKNSQNPTSRKDEYPLISALGPAAGYSMNPTGMSTPRPISPKSSTSHVTPPMGPAASISDVSMTDVSSPRNVISMADDVLKMKTKSPRGSQGQRLKYSSNIQSLSKAKTDRKVSPDSQRPETRRIHGGITLPLDNEGAHVKDRDLDIL